VKRFVLSALFFVALLSIWHLLVLAKVWSVVLLPDPISVWEYLKGAAEDGTLLQASLVTMRRLGVMFVIVVIGLLADKIVFGAVGALSPSAMGHGTSLNEPELSLYQSSAPAFRA
jgi:ABC-type nitrate/sulfonate/bicarbonate transport system permease component